MWGQLTFPAVCYVIHLKLHNRLAKRSLVGGNDNKYLLFTVLIIYILLYTYNCFILILNKQFTQKWLVKVNLKEE